MSSMPWKSVVVGSWPIATKRPVHGISFVAVPSVSRMRIAESASSPRHSSTTYPSSQAIFGLARARSIITFEARSSSRRCTIVTLEANFVRKLASSIAESPPPTTTISCSRKNAPSQTAQYETPRPCRRASDSRPIWRAVAPVATITARALIVPACVSSSCGVAIGSAEKRTAVTSSVRMSAPKRSACARICCISSGPMMPSLKPG